MSPHGRDETRTEAATGRAAKRALFARETELAARVIDYLHANEWQVWQEVQLGRVCDIVAKRGPVVWAIECKLQANLDVLDQASRWTHSAHYVSAAVPYRGGARLYGVVARLLGVGVLWVSESVLTDERGPYRRPDSRARRGTFAPLLTEEARTWPATAGSNDGKRFTEFARFCRDVAELVRANPGETAKQVIDALARHHYASDASARGALISWTREGKVPGVRLVLEGKRLRFYPADAAPAEVRP